MTTQTEITATDLVGDITIPVFTERSATGMRSADLAETIDAQTMERMQDALSDTEFNTFVEALEGDEEIEVGMLRKIAKQIAKPAFTKSASAAREAKATQATLAKLQARIEQLEQEKNQLAESVKQDKTQTSQQQQFQSLSTACSTLGVNLEAALAQEDIVAVLRNEGRSEDSGFTYLEEVTALIAKGKFPQAAQLVKTAVGKVKGAVATPPTEIAGTPSAGAATKQPEGTYWSKLNEITTAYAQSNKTFKDSQARSEKLAALKKQYNMG
jgi:hypothetical protein